MSESSWTIVPRQAGNPHLSKASVAIGVAIVVLALVHIVPAADRTGALCIGLLFEVAGLLAHLLRASVSVLVDAGRQQMLVKIVRKLNPTSAVYRFNEVAAIVVDERGLNPKARQYYLGFRTKSGKFVISGKWSANKLEMNALAGQLASSVGCTVSTGVQEFPLNANHLIFSTLAALLFYGFWYRTFTGPWSLATVMSPALLVFGAVGFTVALQLFRRLPIFD